MLGSALTSWTPILDGHEAALAWEAIESLACALENPGAFGGAEHALGDGLPGPALFFAYLAMATGDERARRRSVELIHRAIDRIASDMRDITLMGGFTGVAWTVEHLQGRVSEPSEEDLNEQVDEVILDALARAPAGAWPSGHELMYGVTGLGVYALERLPRASAREILDRVVARLDGLAERNEEGLTWSSRSSRLPENLRKSFADVYYSLGVAHGPPGVIGFLGMVHAAGIENDRTRSLILDASRWLLARRIPHARGSRFASFHPRPDETPARSSWCYGNPGIPVCLFIAAHALGDEDLRAAAHELALETVRRPHEESGVLDPGLCHGAAGLGHLLNRAYQATGDDRFREGARFWINYAIGMRRPGEGLAGFLALLSNPGDPEPVYKSDPGFLPGASGIGLALLASVSHVEPAWDRVLLASLPPRAD